MLIIKNWRKCLFATNSKLKKWISRRLLLIFNSGGGTNLSYISNVSPQVQPNSSAYIAISNIANEYAIPNSIIYSLSL